MSGLTWIGDSDPAAQSVEQDGVVFVKGEKVEVKDKAAFERLSKNPMFSADGKYEAPMALEPSEEEQLARAEEGTEKAALKAQLRALGFELKGNPSVETLRNKLVEATK